MAKPPTEPKPKPPTCALCVNIAKVGGLCGAHYMSRWRAQQRQIVDEAAEATRAYGPPEEFFCEAPDCPHPPIRWWVRKDQPTIPLCEEHSIEAVIELRLDIRRLELL